MPKPVDRAAASPVQCHRFALLTRPSRPIPRGRIKAFVGLLALVFRTVLLLALLVRAEATARAQVQAQRLKSFGLADQVGDSPAGDLVQGTDGRLYGITTGSSGHVYRVNPDGSGYAAIHDFGEEAGDGQYPVAGLTEGHDGAIYGTTAQGGTNNSGTVYKLNKDGTGYAVLHHFRNDHVDGTSPQGELLEGSDGALYGTTYHGGTNASGTVFKLNEDGTGYALLYAFRGVGGGRV